MQDVITVPNEVAAELAGVTDGVLATLRERLGCAISLRGNRLTLDGEDDDVVAARAVVDELGGRHSSGAAVPVVARALPGGRPVAALAAAFPRLTEALYVRFANNRHRISAFLGTRACGATRASRERPD